MSEHAAAADTLRLEIDGRSLQAERGQMIIQVADAAGINIPRFCYHPKLSIAANCRMCLIEVEGVSKPLPACATPVGDGMKVLTRSPLARRAQKGVMEFLLINHPLDCPICDQGGECELQDLALGYGRDVSRYTEGKRVVHDKDIGPLIATDMTRCIHCTRCVRFGEEIAGIRELGATGRGEHMEIGTYIERSVDSELSGNVIDLCPVGALTSKPFRYRARTWELMQRPTISGHDSIGSNLYAHVLRNTVMRVVPRPCEAINEVWIADRDRYGYQGLNAADRLRSPMLKESGGWREVDWPEALEKVAAALRSVQQGEGADRIGGLIAPGATLEEAYLFAKVMRGMGSAHVDHRLRESDFRDQRNAPLHPALGMRLAEVEALDAALLVGSNVRMELPLLAHRLRKATRRGASVMAVNPIDFEFYLPVEHRLTVAPSAMERALAGIAKAVCAAVERTPSGAESWVNEAVCGPVHEAIAQRLLTASRSAVFLGDLARRHPRAASLRALVSYLAALTDSSSGDLVAGANAVGAWLGGAVPHRTAGGSAIESAGLDAQAMLRTPRRAYVLFGIEPDVDADDPLLARRALREAAFVVAMTAYDGSSLRECADVLLPICPYTETSGTFVNLEGTWQGFSGVVEPAGGARPGWKVLRVLGNHLELAGFGYHSSVEVCDEVRAAVEAVHATAPAGSDVAEFASLREPDIEDGLERIGEIPAYAVDAVVRRAEALQQTAAGERGSVRLRRALVRQLGLENCERVAVLQDGGRAILPLTPDDAVADGCVRIPAAVAGVRDLGAAFGVVRLERA